MEKRMLLVDQFLEIETKDPNHADVLRCLAKLKCYGYYQQNGLRISKKEAMLLCGLLNCNSMEELNGKEITTVVKYYIHNLEGLPVIVAVGKDGLYIPLHISKKPEYRELYTKDKNIRVVTEKELLDQESLDTQVIRVVPIQREEEQEFITK